MYKVTTVYTTKDKKKKEEITKRVIKHIIELNKEVQNNKDKNKAE